MRSNLAASCRKPDVRQAESSVPHSCHELSLLVQAQRRRAKAPIVEEAEVCIGLRHDEASELQGEPQSTFGFRA